MTLPRPRHRRKRTAKQRALKDRLIQTRVPENLQSALKDEARKRRLSVSHLIRNMLEDTFLLVDNVVSEVDNLVHDSVGLARQVRRDAERIAEHARSSTRTRPEATADPAEPKAPEVSLDHVLAWNKVVMNRDGACAKCGKALAKGDTAHLGMTSTPSASPTWLCERCLAA